MLSLSKIKSSGHAEQYFREVDDYYSKDAGASTEWVGKGAMKLGLYGKEVSSQDFRAVLEGRLMDGNKVGQKDHSPGWDGTFSAPKSVSALALASGDFRLTLAHDKAVNDTLAWIEREASFTRIKNKDGSVALLKTPSLLIAKFRHETNREKDPQLHTHAIIMNAIFDELSKKWRSLDSRELYQVKMLAGQIYRQLLAENVQKLGYEIEVTSVGKDVGFEILGVQEELIEYWSSRSAQVEAYLKSQELTRETATAQQKQEATLATRKSKGKGVADHDHLKQHWQKDAEAFNVDLPRLVNQSKERQEYSAANFEKHVESNAVNSVNFALAKLEERSSVFSKSDLLAAANRHGFGNTNEASIIKAIEKAEASQILHWRSVDVWDAKKNRMVEVEAFTTEKNLEIEARMLSAARGLSVAGNNGGKALMTEVQAKLAVQAMIDKSEYPWNIGQIEATQNILASKSRLNLIQGYAGTSKTNSVMAGLASEFANKGYEIKPLAPTASAAHTLGEALKAQGQTVQSYLMENSERTGGKRILIVDEASLLSTNDTKRLLERAERHGDKVVLTGDVKQLGSVEAGEAFRQLQADGHKTERLEDIVRQTNEELRDAVYDSLNGNADAALSKVETYEHDKREVRLGAMRDDYLSLSKDEREKTLLIAPGRDDRQELNALIRSEMIKREELGDVSLVVEVYESADMTKVEQVEAKSYKKGDHIQFQRDYKVLAVAKGETAEVISIDPKKNVLTVKFEGGRIAEFNPASLTKTSSLTKKELEIRAGDQLIRTSGDKNKGEINGSELIVMEVNNESGVVTVMEGREVKDLTPGDLKRINHAYVQTAHQAQGKTYERAYALAESYRSNLVNQKALYVQLSRAKQQVKVYTDNKALLANAVNRRTGEQQTATEGWEKSQSQVKKMAEAQDVKLSTEVKDINRNPEVAAIKEAKSDNSWESIRDLKLAESEYKRQQIKVNELSRELNSSKQSADKNASQSDKAQRLELTKRFEQAKYEIGVNLSNGMISQKEADKFLKAAIKESRDFASAKPGILKSALQNPLKKVELATEMIKLEAMKLKLENASKYKKARETLGKVNNPDRKVDHKAPVVAKSDKDLAEENWQKVSNLRTAEFKLNMQKAKVNALANASNNAYSGKFRTPSKSGNVVKRIQQNYKNSQHNAMVREQMVRNGVRNVKLVYNVAKLKVMQVKLNLSKNHKDARELEKLAVLEKWDKNAASTRHAVNDLDKPKTKSDSPRHYEPQVNLNAANRTEAKLGELLRDSGSEIKSKDKNDIPKINIPKL